MGSIVETIVAARLWGESDLVLVDVGASGGIDRKWSAFGDRLTAVGFEPLIAETDRLNASESRPKVRYEAALVGCREYDELFPPDLRMDVIGSQYIQPFERSSAVAAHRIQQRDYVRELFNAGAEIRYSDRFVTLDKYLSDHALRPDFLKIDTDGSDFQVLLGARHVLDSPDLLGVQIEAQFHGAVHDYANTFSNIDRFLRARGFSLFDLEPYRYSRADLPAPFAIGVPAQTISGQVHWGEAVYFRDLAHPHYEEMFGVAASRERLLKLCALFALYGLPDCAAELLAGSPVLAALEQREQLLDALTPRFFGERRHRDYIARFAESPASWLPQNIARATRESAASEVPDILDERATAAGDGVEAPLAPPWASSVVLARNERLHAALREMRTRIEGLKKIQRKLRRQLDERNQKIKRLQKQREDAKTGLRL